MPGTGGARHALSQLQRDLVEARLLTHMPHEAIQNEVGCSLQQVRQMSANFKRHGTVTAPKNQRQGRPRELTELHVEVCH